MVAGGTEACLDPLTVAGFAKMRALTKHSDPLTASTPFDQKRSGFVIGAWIGAGELLSDSIYGRRCLQATTCYLYIYNAYLSL